MSHLFPRLAVFALVLPLLAGCSGNPNSSLAKQCSDGIDVAYSELNLAETQGFSGSVSWAKAASLLTAAKVQYEFEKYPNCIEKVNRAREYITHSKQG